MLVVSIDLADAPAAAFVRELEAACEAALPVQGRCVAGSGGDGPRAAVVWLDEGKTRVLVRTRDASARSRERTLAFRSTDPDVQRWRSIGFAIGTLFDGVDEPAPQPPSVASASPAPASGTTPAPPPPPAPPRQAPAREIAASASVAVVRTVGGVLAIGSELRGSADVGPVAYTLAVGGTLDRDSGAVESRLLWASAGARLDLVTRASARIGARGELLVVEVYAEHHGVGPVESRSRVVPGLRGGLDLELPVAGWVRVVASTGAGVMAGRTRFRVGDTEGPSLDLLRLEGSVGLGGRF